MTPHASCSGFQPQGGDNARPMILAWDGRIDNRAELLWRLRESLNGEVNNEALVLAAHERWGIAGLRNIIGDWSVVIREGRTADIILASDFAGVRPLYYHWRPDRILWCSRLMPVVEMTGIDALDERYVAGFLTYGGCPTRTPYDGIHAVPAGHAVRATATGITAQALWSLPTNDVVRYRDERRYDEQTARTLSRGSGRASPDAASRAAELGGGLDSSSVVCIATHLMRTRAVETARLTTVSYEHRDSGHGRSFARSKRRATSRACTSPRTRIRCCAKAARRAPRRGVGGPVPVRSCGGASDRRQGAPHRTQRRPRGGQLDRRPSAGCGASSAPAVASACHDAFAWSKLLRTPIAQILFRGIRAALPPAHTRATIYAMDRLPVGSRAGVSDTSMLPAFTERTGLH